MTPPASLNRVEVLSGLAGTIGDNLSEAELDKRLDVLKMANLDRER